VRDAILGLDAAADPARLGQQADGQVGPGPLEVQRVERERVEHFGERAGRALDLPLPFRLELVQILIDRRGRLDLVLDPIEPGHQTGGRRRGTGCLTGPASGTRAAWPSGSTR